ncbi:hypothetical protein [Streptomyces griseorubiginosus]|uniref:hypothetical protein n=1 Tax=Streptomyces griseorubiginosus TaxID=67304 RepID=UPI00331EFBAB
MPLQDPANEPEAVQMIWFGEEMSQSAKAGLRELSLRFPNSKKELVVMPRSRPGEAGQQRRAELMAGYRAEAEQYGVEVVNVRGRTAQLAKAVEGKYTADTINDIYTMEMSNHGYIAAKDLTQYLLRGTGTGLTLDLSHHHMTGEEWDAVQVDPNFSEAVVAPVDFSTAELKIVDLSHGQDANYRHVLHAGYQALSERHDEAGIDYQMMPHLDVFAMYTREGTRGQQVAQAAASQYIGYLAQMSQDEVRKGNVTFRPNDTSTRFRPETINLADNNLLAAKYNTQDPGRADIIGRMAVSALADGIHLVYGEAVTPPGGTSADMPVINVRPEVMSDISMRAFQVGNSRVLPQLSLGKTNQGEWRTDATNDPGDLSRIHGERVTLVQAANLGVRQAAEMGFEGLNKPSRITYDVHRQARSEGGSPIRTPSPASSEGEGMSQIAAGVANLQMPRTPSPEGSNPTGKVSEQPRPPVHRAATTGMPAGR